MGDFEPLHGKTIARIQDGVIELLLAIKVWPVIALDHTAQGDIVFIDIHRLTVKAWVNPNFITRCGLIHRILNTITLPYLNDCSMAERG